jgi:hypothetical protein
MYGLPQAGRLANDLLVKCLAPNGYRPVRHTHGLWKHNTRTVTFTLVIDDFGIKYVGKEHVDHLLQALKQEYEVTEDWSGELYCGITLYWDYKDGTVDLSMPGYVDAALHKFQQKPPTRSEHAPYPARAKLYGAKVQITPEQDTSAALSVDGRKRIQLVVGSLVYYGRGWGCGHPQMWGHMRVHPWGWYCTWGHPRPWCDSKGQPRRWYCTRGHPRRWHYSRGGGGCHPWKWYLVR